MVELLREIHRGGDHIVGHALLSEAAALDLQLFHRAVAEGLEDAAVDLAVDDQLVDGLADLVGGPDADRLDLVRQLVHLDLDAGDAPAVAEVGVAAEGRLIPRIAVGMLVLDLGGEVALVPALLHLLRGALDEAADDHGRAGGRSRAGVHDLGGIGIEVLDLVDAHAKRGGADLAEARFEALPHFGGADLNADPIAGLDQPRVCLDDSLLAVAGECAAVVVERNADALSAAGLVFLCLAPIVGFTGDDVQHLGELDLLDDMAVGGGLVALLGEVLHLERKRVHAEVVRQMVEMRLDGKEGLRRAEAAERAGREHIGADALALEVCIVEGVDAVAVEHAALEHDVGRGKIRAAVIIDVAVHAGDLSVLHRGLVDALGRMALDGELRVLLAVKDHLDGLADLVLRHQQSAAQHVGEMLLAAERAAGGALADDDIVIGNVQQARDRLADIERTLGGGIEDELAVLHRYDGAVGLEVDVLLIGRFDSLLKDLVRLSEHLVHRPALFAEQLAHDVAVLLGEHGAADAVDAVVDGDGGLLLLIVDLDLRLEPLQNAAVRADHKADRLADVEHIVLGKAAPVLGDHPQLVFALRGNVLGGDEMIPLRQLRQMDGRDPAAGNGGAHHVSVLHIGQRHVADIHRLAPRLLDCVHADDPVIDPRRLLRRTAAYFRHRKPPSASPPVGDTSFGKFGFFDISYKSILPFCPHFSRSSHFIVTILTPNALLVQR